MDLAKLGTELLSQSMGSQGNEGSLADALGGLLGDSGGNIDLAGLASKMSSDGDLGGILSSWLGDGDNSPISVEKLTSLFGEGQLAEFAAKLGTDTSSATASLSDVLPQLVDKSSSGGNLLDSLGGVGGLMDAAKSFLK